MTWGNPLGIFNRILVITLDENLNFKEEFITNNNNETFKGMHRQMQNMYAYLKCQKQTTLTY